MDWWRALLGGTCVATVGGEDDGLDCTKSKQLTRFVGGANITINTSRSRRSVEGGLCLCHFMTRKLSQTSRAFLSGHYIPIKRRLAQLPPGLDGRIFAVFREVLIILASAIKMAAR